MPSTDFVDSMTESAGVRAKLDETLTRPSWRAFTQKVACRGVANEVKPRALADLSVIANKSHR